MKNNINIILWISILLISTGINTQNTTINSTLNGTVIDQNVGKVLEKLKTLKKDKNTLIVFISDNGAQGGFNTYNPLRRGLVKNDGPIGTSGSFDYQEQNWAYLSNTPLQDYKNNMHEGGFSSPFITWCIRQKLKPEELIKEPAI